MKLENITGFLALSLIEFLRGGLDFNIKWLVESFWRQLKKINSLL